MKPLATSPALGIIAALASLLLASATRTSGSDSAKPPDPDFLVDSFKRPPPSAFPRTWWHWTNGNITKDGITKDLEWMKRVGIGGFQLADVGFGAGQTVEPKVDFGSPEWLDAVRHAAAEADRLGLEMTIFSSPGWSITGGPWVKPEQAMKKLVWSETVVDGPRRFTGTLAAPPSVTGPIRNWQGSQPRPGQAPDPTWYADAAVIAYRTPEAEQNTQTQPPPTVTTHAGPIDGTALLDDDLNSTVTIAAPEDGSAAWVQFTYDQPFTAQAITLAGSAGIPVGRVLAGDDADHLRSLVELPGAQLYRQGRVRTFAFPETRAQIFRIEMTGAPLGPAATMSQAPSEPAKSYVLNEAIVHAGARVHRWEEKAVFSFLFEYESVRTPAVPKSAVVAEEDIIDLTGRMSPDGTLEWDVPAGRWTILRMGASLTGAKNRPPVPAGLGFEADKLSRAHMDAYLHGYFDPIQQALGPLWGKALSHVLIDSWEAGYQNWTDDMRAEFRTRRGYDPSPWLPVLTGRIVHNADASDRFLWDFRRTLADMWAENHYGLITERLHERGLKTYSEASGVSLEIPEDTLLNKSRVDIPMGEFWVRDLHPRLMYFQDVRGAASAAHIYGKSLVAAEAFTGGGYESPATLKAVGDYWFAQGINRIVFHTSAHQPLDTPPGNTMVGTHLHRNITWADQAAPFMTYVARTSHLLQQGQFVADIAYLVNEGAPSTMPIWGAGTTPPPPPGYDYDFINADVLLNRLHIADDGRLVLPSGMRYRVLVLPQTDRMRPELLHKIRDLVSAGAIICGPRPVRSPSLQGFPACDDEVRDLAAEIWGDLDGVSRTIRRVGQGAVYWGLPLAEVLAARGIERDFACSTVPGGENDVAWIHRRTADSDIYFVANTGDRERTIEARFRVTGRAAELWHADTGAIEPASFEIEKETTTVPLALDPHESVFVVFRQPTAEIARTVPVADETVLGSITGPWTVTFPPNLGAPPSIAMAQLASWTANADDGVKYFSGTATYSKTIHADATWFRPDARLVLDLGAVHDLAEVIVNGQSAGVAWSPPYRVDVTATLHTGDNRIEIKVTNEWTNRLLGDQALPEDGRVLGVTRISPGGIGNKIDSPLDSGLLGPVRVLRVDVTKLSQEP